MKSRFWCLVTGFWLLVIPTGCVHRALTIRTEPPGAMVYVNDQLKGTSPVTYDFTWYGWHRLMIRKEGFERVDDRKMLRAPVYLWIPLDFVMECMPFAVRDERTWEYALHPLPAAEPAVPSGIPSSEPGAASEPATPSASTAIDVQAEVATPEPMESSDAIR